MAEISAAAFMAQICSGCTKSRKEHHGSNAGYTYNDSINPSNGCRGGNFA